MEDDRRRGLHDRARSPQACGFGSLRSQQRRQDAGTLARRRSVRGCRRRGLPAVRTPLEVADAGGEPGLSEEADPALFPGARISDITREDVQSWFSSLHATPVAADRSRPRSFRSSCARQRSTAIVPRAAIPASTSGAIGAAAASASCHRRNSAGSQPCWRNASPRQGSDHPASHSHRLPQERSARTGVAGLPRGQAVSAGQQGRSAPGVAEFGGNGRHRSPGEGRQRPCVSVTGGHEPGQEWSGSACLLVQGSRPGRLAGSPPPRPSPQLCFSFQYTIGIID